MLLRKNAIRIASSAMFLAAAFGLAGTGAANAESVMKVCGDQWKQAKANGTTNGMTWKDFLAKCREEQKGAAAAPAAAPAPAPAAPASTATAAAGKSAKECNEEYAANKDAIKASGQKKKDFIAACRAGTENVPPAAAAPAPAPAAAPAPAPAPAAAAPAPKPAAPKPMAPPTGAGEFQTDAEAKAKCPTDTVVWVNTNTGIYHFAGTHSYGKTKQGAYMCEADAKAAGHRASEKEKHP
jgi:pyruvate/2-oxoglutarate dehydrogenase complex dihydrolipoamide acyltransferase (E2) component